MRLLSAFTKISKKAYLVAVITFFMRAGHFMSLPFLAIYLARQGLLSPSQIGMVLGISGLIFSLTSLINGLYIDRSSHKNIIIGALLLSSICYFGFAFSMQLFYGLLLLNAALGWFRSLIDVSSMKILVTHSKSEHLSYAYSARFIGANLGVVLGPLIGAVMATHQSLLIFYLAGAFNIVLAIVMLFYSEPPRGLEETKPKFNLRENFSTVIKDKTLVNITIINLIIWIVYSQIDTTLPQYLAYEWNNPAVIFSVLMATNALICVIFQPFVLRWAELTSPKISGILGSLMFSTSFILIGAHPTTITMIAAVIIMTLGELFTLPINGLLIMRVAPKHLIASYNGFTNLGMLGLSIGPVLGGYGLQLIGGREVFLLSALLPIIAGWLYFKGVSVEKEINNEL